MDDNQPDEAILQQTYKTRDEVWQRLGTVDGHVLAHLINPSFTGEPDWPDLRRAYKVIHLENGNTIIATDGLSDPFMKNHQFYDAGKNGFGIELYIEITEPFSMGNAGGSWWFNILSQMALQVAYNGNVLDMINSNSGLISTELHNVPLPQEHTFEGRAPVLLGITSKTVPAQVEGPLSPINFISVTLLTPNELDYVVDKKDEGRRFITDAIVEQVGGPVSSIERKTVVPKVDAIETSGRDNQKDNVGGVIDLQFKQSWLEKSTETALEEFKSAFADYLNSQYSDRHTTERWSVTKSSEGEVAHLIYDEQPIATFKVEQAVLRFTSNNKNIVRYDDLMYAARLVALRLGLAVYSMAHDGVRLPATPSLALDHTYFNRNNEFLGFFKNSNFAPRYCVERYEERDGGGAITVNSPYYLEDKNTGAIHIANYPMLDYLVQKDNQQVNQEFSYKVADSMNDFAKKYDFALVPVSFYRNYGKSTKIINDTDFDISHINRKVFIDPYVWDFDADHDPKYYSNVKNGMHLMDKVRKGEDLNTAIKRVLKEELEVADDYVGARIWGIDFDRDRDGILTPRLKINVFVRGMADRQRSKDHDWVSIK